VRGYCSENVFFTLIDMLPINQLNNSLIILLNYHLEIHDPSQQSSYNYESYDFIALFYS